MSYPSGKKTATVEQPFLPLARALYNKKKNLHAIATAVYKHPQLNKILRGMRAKTISTSMRELAKKKGPGTVFRDTRQESILNLSLQKILSLCPDDMRVFIEAGFRLNDKDQNKHRDRNELIPQMATIFGIMVNASCKDLVAFQAMTAYALKVTHAKQEVRFIFQLFK